MASVKSGFAHVTFNACHQLAPAGVQAELLRLYVQEPFVGKQVGTQLLAQAERLAAEAGATVLWLTPWVHNHRAIEFYLRRGYTDFGLTSRVSHTRTGFLQRQSGLQSVPPDLPQGIARVGSATPQPT